MVSKGGSVMNVELWVCPDTIVDNLQTWLAGLVRERRFRSMLWYSGDNLVYVVRNESSNLTQSFL